MHEQKQVSEPAGRVSNDVTILKHVSDNGVVMGSFLDSSEVDVFRSALADLLAPATELTAFEATVDEAALLDEVERGFASVRSLSEIIIAERNDQ